MIRLIAILASFILIAASIICAVAILTIEGVI